MAEIEKARRVISIVMPAMNEEENIPKAYTELNQVFSNMPEYDYEVILIDNDSTDKTAEISEAICQKDSRWKYVKFSRNFSAEISIAAGLRYSSGDAVIILFSDLQDPPQLIPEFVRKWEDGYDVVCGMVNERADGAWWKKIGAKSVYWILNKLSDISIPANVVDFRLMSRQVVNAINKMQERNRYFRGLAHWVGFKSTTIAYDRKPRVGGTSKAPFFYLIDFTLRALTNFSILPLRFFSGFGVLVLIFAFIYLIYTLVQFALGQPVPGLTTIISLLLLNLALLSIGIGTLGEYVGRIYIESKQRPLWVVEKAVNISVDDEIS